MRLRFALVAIVLAAAACNSDVQHEARQMTGGDPERGRTAIVRYGCPSCHQIPGIRGAKATVAPPLIGIAGRTYIAGKYTNTPENMIRFIRFPQQMDPQIAMPNMNMTERDGRDIAAYLYTLQ